MAISGLPTLESYMGWEATAPVVNAPTTSLPAMLASYTAPSEIQPSIWQTLATPWVQSIKAVAGAVPTIAGAVSQSIHDILIAKYLTPKTQNQGTYSVIQLEKPQAGTAAPTTVSVVPQTSGMVPATTLNLAGLGQSSWLMILPMAVMAILLLRKK